MLWGEIGGSQLGGEEELAGPGNGTAVTLSSINRLPDSLAVVCKDRRAQRDGRVMRAEMFAAQLSCSLLSATSKSSCAVICCHTEKFTGSNAQGKTCSSRPP